MSHSHNDMDMGDMSEMGGMDMSSTGLFLSDNKKIAHGLWYIVAAVALIRGSRALFDYTRTFLAKRKHTDRSAIPSKPTNIVTQSFDTIITALREISYPAPRPLQGRFLRSFTPPPVGQSFIILTYWVVILIMLFTNVFLGPNSSLYGYKWEKPAFRAAWVSITQVPLLYALSCKFNVISILTGISYERLNWLHRWVSRTLFLTIIIHWAYFFHEWSLADFVQYQLKIMPMVKYGFGAWAVIGWSVITGFGFFRELCYELWVLQHLASAGVLLWLLYVHVPSYARYNIWLAIGFVVFDRGVRGIWALVNNLHLRYLGKGGVGFRGQATSLPNGYLKLTLKDVDFNWRPGQHVFLSMPACGIFESHPFTIANTRLASAPGCCNKEQSPSKDLEVVFKCHSGFTRRLQQKARSADGSIPTHRVFLSGPWGSPPLKAIERSNALVFIASSTGASFNMPLLEHAIKTAPFVQRICFFWVVRHASQVSWFDVRLRAAMRQLAALGLEDVTFKIFVTGSTSVDDVKTINLPADTTTEVRCCWMRSHGLPYEMAGSGAQSVDEITEAVTASDEKAMSGKEGLLTTARSTSSISDSSSEVFGQCCGCRNCKCRPTLASPSFTYSLGRPCSFDSLIRPTVEAAQGETVIVACGGRDMMAQVRTYVASLSDERAVHKGTGAQGIHLWTESYGW